MNLTNIDAWKTINDRKTTDPNDRGGQMIAALVQWVEGQCQSYAASETARRIYPSRSLEAGAADHPQ